MPTEEQIRRINVESYEAAQLQRLTATDSFQPTRPPPVPGVYINPKIHEDISRFSDSDDDSPLLGRAVSFARGGIKRDRKYTTASLNRVRLLPSTEILQLISEEPEKAEPKSKVSRCVSAAATRALAASQSLKTPRRHRFWDSPFENGERKQPEVGQKYEDLQRRGMVPPWKLMRQNRNKSREGSFLCAGTLRKSKDDKEPKRSHTVADPETVQAKRDGTIFFTG